MIPEDLKKPFVHSLYTGQYNMLLGSGVTGDCTNWKGVLLQSTSELKEALCSETGAPSSTSLRRVAGMLDENQRQSLLTEPFVGCNANSSLARLPGYVWRRIFTFNIDDAIEAAYRNFHQSKQTLRSVNFSEPLYPTPKRYELLAIHLHGWVKDSESGYVFSHMDYARGIQSLNPWLHMVSETLATEPYIISGTSLEEEDLEYYLVSRSEVTPRKGRGPSLYIEPFPTAVTRHECKRHGLVLVEATFEEFIAWLSTNYPSPPTLAELVVPNKDSMFSEKLEGKDLLQFFSDFEPVEAGEQPKPHSPSKFMYGREPDWSDLHKHYDIEREDNGLLMEALRERLDSSEPHQEKTLVVLGQAGTGKTTTAKRVVHDLALEGRLVLNVIALGRIDTRIAAACLRKLSEAAIVFVDGVADHAEQIEELREDPDIRSKVTFVGSERAYRQDHLDVVFSRHYLEYSLKCLTQVECQQLVEQYRSLGLLGNPDAVRNPKQLARSLVQDPVAVSVCRILNDFRPLERIAASLWDAANAIERVTYLCVALAHHCHKTGLHYNLLQVAVGPLSSVDRQLDISHPLAFVENPANSEYIRPSNSILGERILLYCSRQDKDRLRAAFDMLARNLAPYVNRRAIMKRTPEARIAGRLFDFDAVVHPLLGEDAESFYLEAKPNWEWNSRYWEQRAHLAALHNLDEGIQFARQAVAIEPHPFPLTTLASLLLRKLEEKDSDIEELYLEALDTLDSAIKLEARRSRVTVHPYSTLLKGTTTYLERGGRLIGKDRELIIQHLQEARTRFESDAQIQNAVSAVNLRLQ